MGDGSHLENETVANDGGWPRKEGSIIRPKRRAERSFFGGGNRFAGGGSFANILGPIIDDTREVKQVLLGEFRIQEDV